MVGDNKTASCSWGNRALGSSGWLSHHGVWGWGHHFVLCKAGQSQGCSCLLTAFLPLASLLPTCLPSKRIPLEK